MDREHLDRFEAIEKRLDAIEKRTMPQPVSDAEAVQNIAGVNSLSRGVMSQFAADTTKLYADWPADKPATEGDDVA